MALSSILYLWNKWNIRGFVILSLLLQIFLILFAPLRKKTKNKPLVFLLWLAYLIADLVAAFGIGLISCAHATEANRALQVFWASFLLLHLGGPDTIIALSLEDSSLWQRHLLNIIFQVSTVIYVFVQTFPSNKSLMLPTMLIFLAGIIKNVERTLALNLSSLPRLKEWMLLEQEFLDDEALSNVDLLQEGYYDDIEGRKLAESIVVKHAYYFFQISKVFLTDLIFTQKQREKSQRYFYGVSAVDALRVISVELHFIYKVLHTKALTIRSKLSYVFRFVAFIDVVMAFYSFNRLKKHQLAELDVKITYLLLFGGISLDVIAVLMLIFSDWTIAEIQWHKTGSSKIDSFFHNFLSTTDDLWKPRFTTCEAKPSTAITYEVLDTSLLFRRWSESIYACNLLSESLGKNPRKIYKSGWRWGNLAFSNICSFPSHMAEKTIIFFHQAVDSIAGGCGLRKMDRRRSVIANARYVSTNPFIMTLWSFIFKEVKRKFIYMIHPDQSEERERTRGMDKWIYGIDSDQRGKIERTKEIYEARGNWFLRILMSEARHHSLNYSDTVRIYEATDNEFPQNIQNIQGRSEPSITMSSVTDVNYYESVILWHLATEIWYNREDPTSGNEKRELSKFLSDYMFYLLFNQSKLMSAVAGIAPIRLADILRILRSNFRTNNVKSLCEAIFSPDQDQSADVRGSHLITGGIKLARELEVFGEVKWEVMSGVWVEMLSYAAGHIKGEAHAQVLSKGGELLTFVWLLMIHFGLFHRPEWAPSYIYRKR